MGVTSRIPHRGIAILPSFEFDDRDVIVLSGGRVLDVIAVLDDDVNPGNGRNIFVVVILYSSLCPRSQWKRNVVVVVWNGWVEHWFLLPWRIPIGTG